MSTIAKLEIGFHLRIQYNDKWYAADIIDIIQDTISIKLWKSAVKYKLFDITKKQWRNWVFEKKVISNMNKIFPSWIQISQRVYVLHKKLRMYYQITDYKADKSITMFAIHSTTHNHPNNTIKLKIKTQKISLSQSADRIMINNGSCLCFKEMALIPTVYPPHNKQLVKKLISIQQNKQNDKNIKVSKRKTLDLDITQKDMEIFEFDQYVNDGSDAARNVLMKQHNELFPEEVNKIIISYLKQKLIYICPPSRCITKQMKLTYVSASTKDYSWRTTAVHNSIGCQFRMKKSVQIIGFGLYHDQFKIHRNSIYLHEKGKGFYTAMFLGNIHGNNEYIEYLFEQPIMLNVECLYRIGFAVSKRGSYYKWHETPYGIFGSDKYKEYGIDNWLFRKIWKQYGVNMDNYSLTDWKIFKEMRWIQYMYENEEDWAGGSSLFNSLIPDCSINAFPQITLLLSCH